MYNQIQIDMHISKCITTRIPVEEKEEAIELPCISQSQKERGHEPERVCIYQGLTYVSTEECENNAKKLITENKETGGCVQLKIPLQNLNRRKNPRIV